MPAKKHSLQSRPSGKRKPFAGSLAFRLVQSLFVAIFLAALLVPSVTWFAEILWPCREVLCWRQLHLSLWIPLSTAVLLPLIYLLIKQTSKIPSWILWLSGAGVVLWISLYLHGIWFAIANDLPGGLF